MTTSVGPGEASGFPDRETLSQATVTLHALLKDGRSLSVLSQEPGIVSTIDDLVIQPGNPETKYDVLYGVRLGAEERFEDGAYLRRSPEDLIVQIKTTTEMHEVALRKGKTAQVPVQTQDKSVFVLRPGEPVRYAPLEKDAFYREERLEAVSDKTTLELTARLRQAFDERRRGQQYTEALRQTAEAGEKYHRSLWQLAFAWIMRRPTK